MGGGGGVPLAYSLIMKSRYSNLWATGMGTHPVTIVPIWSINNRPAVRINNTDSSSLAYSVE